MKIIFKNLFCLVVKLYDEDKVSSLQLQNSVLLNAHKQGMIIFL
jgi:hypothetical protein